MVLILLFGYGCDEEPQQGIRDAAEHINSSGSGLVQIVESDNQRVVSKYLTPEYLAHTEREAGLQKGDSFDSLVNQYGETMSFYVVLEERSEQIQEESPERFGENEGRGRDGVINVEAASNMFHLKYKDSIWTPVCVLPEARAGIGGKTWFVVFAINPDQMFQSSERVELVYSDPDNAYQTRRFIYNASDLVHS